MNNETQEKDSLIIFSNELEKLLKQSNITQLDFAHKLGVSKNSVNKWIKGITQPKLHQLKLIIEFFISNDKTRDFNPLHLFFSNSFLNDVTSSEYKNAILRIQEKYDLKLSQQNDNLWKKIKELESKCADRSKLGEEYSKRKSYLESLLLEKHDYKKELSKLKTKEKTLTKEIRNQLVRKVVYHNIYPESTAKKVLQNEKIKGLVKRMYEIDNEEFDTYKNYFENLYNDIIATLEYEMTNIIKNIIYDNEN